MDKKPIKIEGRVEDNKLDLIKQRKISKEKKIENIKLKQIMTDLAAGHITKKEADELIKAKKTSLDKPEEDSKEKSSGDHARKRKSKSREVK